MKEKYTMNYFLKQDDKGSPSEIGVVGIEEFNNGDIRHNDRQILKKVNFKNKNVLCFGYGRGEEIKYAKDSFAAEVTGVDFAEASYDVAQDMLKKFKIEANLYRDDALAFLRTYKPKANIDIVVMLDFVEHIPRDELTQSLAKIKSIISKKAIIVINTPVFKADNDVIKEGLKKEAMDNSDEYEETAGMHCNRYTKESLIDYMMMNGFGCISAHIFGLGFKSRFLQGSNRWTKAKKQGYPLLGEYEPDTYEYAATKQEIGGLNNQSGGYPKELLPQDAGIKSDYDANNIVHGKVAGHKFLTHGRFADYYLNKDRDFERHSILNLKNFLRKGDVFVDIGAHHGYYSVQASEIVGDKGTIYAFEPVPENAKILKKNLDRINSRHYIYDIALSDKTGSADFNIPWASDSGGLFQHPLAKNINKITVKVEPLDNILQNQRIDFVKIDTEGNELAVLRGMEKVIDKNKNIKLLLEFNPDCLNNAGTNPELLLRAITKLGFDIYFVNDKDEATYKYNNLINYRDYLDDNDYINILCTPKNVLSVILFSHTAETNGAERSLVERSMELVRRGAIVAVSVPGNGPLKQLCKQNNIPVTTHPASWWINKKDYHFSNDLLAIEDLMYRYNYEFVASSTIADLQIPFISRRLFKKHIWFIHEDITRFTYPFGNDDLAKYIESFSNFIILPSVSMKKFLSDKFEVFKKALVYYPISSLARVTITKPAKLKKQTIVCVGSVEENKNQMDLVKAFEVLKQDGNNKDVELKIVGNCTTVYAKKLKKYIEINKLSENVQLVGSVDNAQDFIGSADVLVSCSHSESFARVVVEAFCNKTPVICTDTIGVNDYAKDGYNAYLYKPGDYKMLAKLITKVLNDGVSSILVSNALGTYDDLIAKSHQQFDQMLVSLDKSSDDDKGLVEKILLNNYVNEVESLNNKLAAKERELVDVNISHAELINLHNSILSSKAWKLARMARKVRHPIK